MKMCVTIAALCAAAGMAGAQLATVNGSGSVAGNGNAGFGGVIGPGSMDIVTNPDGSVSLTVNRGGAEFFDQMVIYIDSTAGGFADTTALTDTADGGRIIASGTNGGGSANIFFASGFEADYAISIEQGFSGIFQLVGGGSHNFSATANTGFSSSDASFTLSFNLADIGIAAGDSFKMVANYHNAFDGAGPFRSDEWFGAATAAGNTGQADVQLGADDFILVNSIPTPGALGALGVAGLLAARRRR